MSVLVVNFQERVSKTGSFRGGVGERVDFDVGGKRGEIETFGELKALKGNSIIVNMNEKSEVAYFQLHVLLQPYWVFYFNVHIFFIFN